MANLIKPPCDEAIIRSAPDTAPSTQAVGRCVLVVTNLGSSMAFIDGTAINVALPVLQRSLNATVANVQWMVEAYALLLASGINNAVSRTAALVSVAVLSIVTLSVFTGGLDGRLAALGIAPPLRALLGCAAHKTGRDPDPGGSRRPGIPSPSARSC